MPGRTFSLWRLADLSWRYDWATMPLGQSPLRFRSAGNYLPRREAAKDGGGIGRAPASAGGSSVIRSAKLAAWGENRKHARNSPTRFGFGGAASVMSPLAVSALGQRKPMPAQGPSDVAVSANSPAISSRGNRPLGRTNVTSSKKSSEALRRRCSPAGVADQAEQTDARTSSQRSRHYCGVAIVIVPSESTTHMGRVSRGPDICTKRQFGGAVRVIFLAAVTM